METADKDGEQGCVRAAERPPSSNGVRACLHYESWAPRHSCLSEVFAPLRKCSPSRTLAFHQGGDIQQCCICGALQDGRSHLSSLFSWWDIFKGRCSHETGSSFMLIAAAFLGEMHRPPPLTPFSICHQPIKRDNDVWRQTSKWLQSCQVIIEHILNALHVVDLLSSKFVSSLNLQ